MKIFAYKPESESAKALASAMGVLCIKHINSKYKGHESKLVINWGATSVPDEVNKSTIINTPEAVAVAADKILTFKAMADVVSVPTWTTESAVASDMLANGYTLVSRSTAKGKGGQGITIIGPNSNAMDVHYALDTSVLFTKYIPKTDEFRVHVVNGEVIDVRRKARRNDFKHPNWKIRSYANGFIFQKDGFEVPPMVTEESVKAVAACGLVFGAVDVIWNKLRGCAYVLEVNTAPGLEGSTIDSYNDAFEKLMDDWKEDVGGIQALLKKVKPKEPFNFEVLEEIFPEEEEDEVEVYEDEGF